MAFLDETGLGRLWAQIILKLNSKVPDGGTTGQILKKTETGTEWANESGAADVVQSNLDTHVNNTTVHVTTEEKSAWNAKLDSYTETDPTVPDWAKQSTKPTYTADEVGADVSGSAASVQSNLDTHVNNTNIHVTAEEKSAWNAKLDSYTETDPTVPDWAKAASKPTYTASEVGADVSGSAASVQSNLDTHVNNTNIHITSDERTIWNAKADAPFKPEGKSYLTFSSSNSFTLAVEDATKHWDGILEYFASDRTWTTWDGATTLSAVADDGEYVLYLRGTGNTVITGYGQNYRWVLTGSDIACIGNIENLLDCATVKAGNHPTMASYCYYSMFRGCTGIIQAPALPATTLANDCYHSMFYNCTSLTQAPALPATTLAPSCYDGMFNGCTSLTQAPALPATTLADYCYNQMFNGCTSLTQAPALPATTLANDCYHSMFYNCTSLTQAPSLPATTLADNCYYRMLSGCTALTQAPALPATTLANDCYHSMLRDSTSLKLSSTQTGEYTVAYRIPTTGTGTTATSALTDMFTATGGTFTGTPEINTTYYLSSDNMVVHETEVATLNGYIGSMIEGLATQEYVDGKVPNDGTTGQVLKKTETGTEWADAPQSTLPEDIVKYTTQSQVEDVASIDASTLEGHSSSYFATTDALTALTVNVSTNSEDISTLRNDISNINVIPDKHAATLLPDSADLNTYNTIDKIGWYYTESTTSMSNVPSGVTAFGLDVGRNSDSGFYQKLMVSSSTENAIYYRNYASSTWTSWEKIIFGSPATYTVTLTTSGWAQSGGRYAQTVNVTGVTASTPVVLVDVALSGTDIDADAAALEAWGIVSANNVAQGNGTLTFYALSVPSVNIPVNVGVF